MIEAISSVQKHNFSDVKYKDLINSGNKKPINTAFRVLNGKDGVVRDDAACRGVLFTGETYIFLITYDYKNQTRYLVYFWNGRESPAGSKAASTLLSQDLTALGIEKGPEFVPPNHVLLFEGKETPLFLSLFSHNIIVVLSGRYRESYLPCKTSDRLLIKLYHSNDKRPVVGCQVCRVVNHHVIK